MAGARLRRLIDVAALRPEWLATAELSVPIDPSRTSAGLSVFFQPPGEADDARAFLDALGAPASVLALETSLRRDLSLGPRRWFKTAYERGQPTAIAHYFQIDPRVEYPIATIRHFLRKTGTSYPDTLENALRRELEAPDLVWGLVARHPTNGTEGDRVHAKLSLAVPPSQVASLVERLFGARSARDAAEVAGLGGPSSNEVFVTFTPGRAESLQIDVTAPRPADLPCAFDGLGVDWPDDRRLAYAKWRAKSSIWTAYVPLEAYRRMPRGEGVVTVQSEDGHATFAGVASAPDASAVDPTAPAR